MSPFILQNSHQSEQRGCLGNSDNNNNSNSVCNYAASAVSFPGKYNSAWPRQAEVIAVCLSSIHGQKWNNQTQERNSSVCCHEHTRPRASWTMCTEEKQSHRVQLELSRKINQKTQLAIILNAKHVFAWRTPERKKKIHRQTTTRHCSTRRTART